MDTSLLVPIATPIIVNGLSLAYTWGKLNQRITTIEKQNQESMVKQNKEADAMDDIKVDAERVKVALFGIHGNNGMNGTMKELSNKVEAMQHDITAIKEQLKEMARNQERLSNILERIESQLNDG